ncbi:DUF1517 domain-containing protein [Neosynechococcus sphagnicola]|uniref:DUF1517 domain-containing protein n=1 Tax=Neosynechococcus sphagnicola TaxID=1501145 RepID=UPI000B2E6FA1
MGSLFGVFIFLAIANFLVQAFRRSQSGEGSEMEGYSDNPTVSVSQVQVGLLAGARELQIDLEKMARAANTNSSEGLVKVLQETTLALLRHPEFWAYAGAETQQTKLQAAETQFNRYSLAARSKIAAETLSNVNNQLEDKSSSTALLNPNASAALAEAPGEYIVVTVLVGALGKLALPEVKNTDDLRRTLTLLGGVGSEQLLAVEVMWSPEAQGDVLTSDDLLADYPSLRLI